MPVALTYYKQLMIIGIFITLSSLSFYFDYIELVGIAVAAAYGFCCYRFSFNKSGWLNRCIGALIFVSTILLFLHLIPGFNNPLIINGVNVSANAPAYSQYLNFDKALVGVFLLIYVLPSSLQPAISVYRNIILVFLVAYAVAIFIAFITGLVALDMKVYWYFLSWGLVNLCITTFAEEAFFRGFVQTAIFTSLAGKKWHKVITVIASGILFGLAHFPAGLSYMVIASILGGSYAYGYLRTRNILVPILGHFIFNLIHILFFTYPFIAT